MSLFEDKLGFIRKKLAKAMVGSTVDLMADSRTVAHGIVTGVFVTAGAPKIIVNGRTYHMHQVLTATSGSIQ
jgi:nitrous oxidase accessory protein NosD